MKDKKEVPENEKEIYFQNMIEGLINKHGEEHIKARKRAIKTLSKIIKLTAEEVEKENINSEKLKNYSCIVDIILKAVQGQSKILELPSIEEYYSNL